MGHIIEHLKIKGNKGTKDLKVLFDSGAAESVINENEAKQFCDIQELTKPRKFTLPNGSEIFATGICSFETEIKDTESNLECDISGSLYTSPEINLPEKEYTMILGVPTLQKFKIQLNFDDDENKNKIDLSKCPSRIDTL